MIDLHLNMESIATSDNIEVEINNSLLCLSKTNVEQSLLFINDYNIYLAVKDAHRTNLITIAISIELFFKISLTDSINTPYVYISLTDISLDHRLILPKLFSFPDKTIIFKFNLPFNQNYSSSFLSTRYGYKTDFHLLDETALLVNLLDFLPTLKNKFHITGLSKLSSILLLSNSKYSNITFDIPIYQLFFSIDSIHNFDPSFNLNPGLLFSHEISELISLCNQGAIPMLTSHSCFIKKQNKNNPFFDSEQGGYMYNDMPKIIKIVETFISSDALEMMLVINPSKFLNIPVTKSYSEIYPSPLPYSVSPFDFL